MGIFKKAIVLVFLAVVFIFSGCQGNNSEEIPNEVPTVVDTTGSEIATVTLPVSTQEVTTNSEVINITVKVFDGNNNPFTSGEVKIVYPDSVLSGRDVGSFTSSTVAVDNSGTANFTYTSPVDLNADTSDIIFTFYHDSNPTAGSPFTVTITPQDDQIILTNYTLNISNPTDITMGLESTKLLTFSVNDDDNNTVTDEEMISMTISSLNPTFGTLVDSNGSSVNSVTVINDNVVTVNLESYTNSGLNSIQVDAVFRDVNNREQNLSKVFNILVLSGPPSAISLAYAGTEQDAARAKFIEKWVLTVTDKYNNPVDSNPGVTMGMIAGYAQDSSGLAENIAEYLYFNPGVQGGTLSAASDDFTAPNGVFNNVDFDNEVLVTFANGYTYPASGKWDIDPLSSTSNTLALKDDYINTDTPELGFAVGSNYRQDTCEPAIEWVANVYPENNNFIMNDQGSLIINVEYDYYLVGKSTVLWVNLIGEDYASNATVKIGEARKVTLRGQGLESEIFTYAEGYSGIVRLNVKISNTVEWYRNANFSYHVMVTGKDTPYVVVGHSMLNGITSCNNSGIAYVDIEVTAPAGGDGTISLTNVIPTNEF